MNKKYQHSQFTEPVGHIDDRPWGRYLILDQGDGFQVKKIEVDPGKRLSLQSHEHRNEFWIIVQGVFEIELDGKTQKYSLGDVVLVKKLQKHRPKCISDAIGIFIEVQQGNYCGEDDIIRYEDDYGRE